MNLPPDFKELLEEFAREGVEHVDATRTLAETEIVYLGRAPLRVDLLRSIDGVSTADVLKNAVPTTWEGTPIRVIALDDLIANKRAAARAQDLVDVVKLERARAKRAR